MTGEMAEMAVMVPTEETREAPVEMEVAVFSFDCMVLTSAEGNGGSGGAGGNGGDGGAGGRITIEAIDPSLFILVDADVSGGRGGAAGSPGRGGRGGQGGPGGRYQAGSEHRPSIPQGPRGANGRDGFAGRPGTPGMKGLDGYLEYALYDTYGNVLEIGKRYELTLESFTLQNVLADQIFEPLQEVIVSQVAVVNQGDITLPPGAVLSMESLDNSFAVLEPKEFVLGGIIPGERVIFDPNLRLQVRDFPTSLRPGPLQEKAVVSSCIRLRGRSFLESITASEVTVQWPLRFHAFEAPRQLARADKHQLVVWVRSISPLTCYGSDHGSEVTVCWQLVPDLKPTKGGVVIDNIEYREDVIINEGTVTMKIRNIKPKSSVQLWVEVQVSPDAKLYERLEWSTSLMLRDRVIEYGGHDVVVSCAFNPSKPPGDVLLFTGSHMSREECLAWEAMFGFLGMHLDIWDFDYYKALNHKPPLSWTGRYNNKLLIFHFGGKTSLEDLSILDLLIHFVPNYDQKPFDGELLLSDSDSGVVMLGVGGKPLIQGLFQGSKTVSQFAGEEFGGKHVLGRPSQLDAKKKANKLLHALHSKWPNLLHDLKNLKFEPQKMHGKRYTYGQLELSTIPLSRTDYFLLLPSIHGLIDNYYKTIGPGPIPLESNMFAILSTIVSALPLKAKTNLLLRGDLRAWSWNFDGTPRKHKKTKAQGTFAHLVLCALYNDLKVEFQCKDKSFRRLEALVSEVTNKKVDPSNENPCGFAVPAFSALKMMETATYWQRAKPFSKSADIFLDKKKLLEKHLLKTCNVNKKDYSNMKKEVDSLVAGARRLKYKKVVCFSRPLAETDNAS